MWSLEVSQCRGVPHLERIRIPSLVVQSMADTGVFPSDAQIIHDNLAADDKRLEFIPGDHYLENPGNSRDLVADLAADWLRERVPEQ
ncbi:MAG: alpha/beta hydrolase, partial [bacterium]